MKNVMVMLCCLVSIFTIQGMQQTSSQSRPCTGSITYVEHLLENKPLLTKQPEECSTVPELLNAYHPNTAYLQALITYLKAHADEPLTGNRVACAMLGPIVLKHGFSLTSYFFAYPHTQSHPQLCECPSIAISDISNDPKYKGYTISEIIHSIAHTRVQSLAQVPLLLDRDATFLPNVQPPAVQQLIRAEHDAIKRTALAVQRLIAIKNAE